MKTVSLCMIVKNEADTLGEVLDSVKDVVEEIIIVDTGSEDDTKGIAKKYTDHVYDFEWVDDFSAARNAAYSYATKDYILFMDADEYFPEEERKKLLQLKETLDDSVDAVSMFTVMSVDEYGNPVFKFRRHRLVKRSNQFKWHGAVHEYLAVGGHIIHSDICFHHRSKQKEKTDRNLKIYQKRLEKGEEFSPRDMFYYANELREHGFLQEAIEQYNRFLDTKLGWIEDNIRACIYLADCYKLLGDEDKEIESLVRSINYDLPRPEVACRLGDKYLERKMYYKAIIWYNLAFGIDWKDSLGFQLEQYSTWYPHLQCCVCYWNIGNEAMAYFHHEQAKHFIPNDGRVLYNEQFFQKVRLQKSQNKSSGDK